MILTLSNSCSGSCESTPAIHWEQDCMPKLTIASFPGSTAQCFCTLEKHGLVFFQSAKKRWAVEPENEGS